MKALVGRIIAATILLGALFTGVLSTDADDTGDTSLSPVVGFSDIGAQHGDTIKIVSLRAFTAPTPFNGRMTITVIAYEGPVIVTAEFQANAMALVEEAARTARGGTNAVGTSIGEGARAARAIYTVTPLQLVARSSLPEGGRVVYWAVHVESTTPFDPSWLKYTISSKFGGSGDLDDSTGPNGVLHITGDRLGTFYNAGARGITAEGHVIQSGALGDTMVVKYTEAGVASYFVGNDDTAYQNALSYALGREIGLKARWEYSGPVSGGRPFGENGVVQQDPNSRIILVADKDGFLGVASSQPFTHVVIQASLDLGNLQRPATWKTIAMTAGAPYGSQSLFLEPTTLMEGGRTLFLRAIRLNGTHVPGT